MSNLAEIKNLTENLDCNIIQAYFDGGITIRLFNRRLKETKEIEFPSSSVSHEEYMELCSFLWEKLIKKGS